MPQYYMRVSTGHYPSASVVKLQMLHAVEGQRNASCLLRFYYWVGGSWGGGISLIVKENDKERSIWTKRATGRRYEYKWRRGVVLLPNSSMYNIFFQAPLGEFWLNNVSFSESCKFVNYTRATSLISSLPYTRRFPFTSPSPTSRATSSMPSLQYTKTCGSVISHQNFSDGSGTLASPNYPAHYLNYIDCIYRFVGPPGYRIYVFFPLFQTEKTHDFIEVHGILGQSKFSGNLRPFYFITTSNSFWFRFKTDLSVTKRGFYFKFALTMRPPSLFTTRPPTTTATSWITSLPYTRSDAKELLSEIDAQKNKGSTNAAVIGTLTSVALLGLLLSGFCYYKKKTRRSSSSPRDLLNRSGGNADAATDAPPAYSDIVQGSDFFIDNLYGPNLSMTPINILEAPPSFADALANEATETPPKYEIIPNQIPNEAFQASPTQDLGAEASASPERN